MFFFSWIIHFKMLVMHFPQKTAAHNVKKKKWRKPSKRNIVKFIKENCFYVAPIWIFWTYLVSFLITSNPRLKGNYMFASMDKMKLEYLHPSGKKYKVEFGNYSAEKSSETISLYYALVDKITGDINKVKISRIYSYLGGNYLLTDKVRILQRKKSKIKLRSKFQRVKRELCTNTLKLGKNSLFIYIQTP